MEKSTEELTNNLAQAKSVQSYLAENQQELLDFSLPQYLNALLIKKDLDKSEVIKASGLNNIYGYHIFSGVRRPSRDKLLALAFGFDLDLAETQVLLKYASLQPLYARNQRDSVIIFALSHQLSIMICNELLDQENELILA